MNSDTLLLRQIHPSFIQDGKVTSQAFRPTPKDEKKLSVYDGDQINAIDAWNHFTTTLILKSNGVQAITVDECTQCNLSILPDPNTFPEHCLIDYSSYNENEIKKKAKFLKSRAENRGWLYQV